MSPHFHGSHDDDFQTGFPYGSISSPLNWSEAFKIHHCGDDASFTSSLDTKIQDTSNIVYIRLHDDEDEASINNNNNNNGDASV